MCYMDKITNIYHINNTYVFHYLISISVDINATRNAISEFLTILNTSGGAAQHNISTVYISTLANERDPFDFKSISSQTDVTEQ